MKIGPIKHVLLVALAFSLILAFPRPSLAMDMPAYDLDSLVWMASDIVEGTVAKADTTDTDEVDITAVSAGSLKKGDRITVAAMQFFDADGKPLQVGANLFWFLVDAHEDWLFHPPKGAKMPVESGLKMISDGKVRGFFQYMNPGGYELIPLSDTSKGPLPTVEQYRQSIQSSMKKVAAIRDHLKGEPNLDQIPYLLSLLKERPTLPEHDEGDDAIAADACIRIGTTKSPEAIYEALSFGSTNTFLYQASLVGGLRTPEGREFTLNKLADPKADHARRLILAKYGIWIMGPRYWETPDVKTPLVHDNHEFVTRIAKIAASVADDKDLCFNLLSHLRGFAQADNSHDPEVQADLTNAMPVLRDFYKKGADDSQQFEIERICLTFDRKFFDQLEAKGGPMIAEVNDGYKPDYRPPGPGQLLLVECFNLMHSYSAPRAPCGLFQ